MNLNDIAIIIPSLNPDEKFTRVVDGMIAAGFSRFILIDDGSDKDHKQPFEEAAKNPMCTVLLHEVNQGKGQALKDAFTYVYDSLPEIDAVITIDGDGQHTPEDAAKLAERLADKPDEVVFGCRDFDLPNVPTHNKLGNKITSFVFRLLYGMKLSDTQTGLRGIPRKYLLDFAQKVEGTRFEYESNVLIYMSQNKIPFSEVAIQTLYIEENKSSHFRPFRDSVRIYGPILNGSRAFRFVVTGVLCTILDLVLFFVFTNLFKGLSNIWLQNLLCNGLARIISAVANYTANYTYAFRSKAPFLAGAPKYMVVAIGKLAISWVVQTPIFNALKLGGLLRTVTKCIVDLVLAVVSYFVQKIWVFEKK